MAMQSLVMTVIGADRPGLVEMLADIIAKHGGNWLESRLSHLGGQFAGMLRIEISPSNQSALAAALKGLEAKGLTVVLQTAVSQGAAKNETTAVLQLMGSDRPGIVREISRALAARKVNVEELHTELASAPMSGETMFKAEAKLHIPSGCTLADLRSDLEKIAQDLFVDISLQPIGKN